MRRRLFGLLFSLVILNGCSLSASNFANPTSSSNPCPSESQGTLTPENLQKVTFNQQKFKESNHVKEKVDRGYQFQAQAGYRLKSDITNSTCIVVYKPDNQLLRIEEFAKLPVTGSYILQVFVPQGSTQYDLTLSLEDPRNVAVAPSVPPIPSPSPNNLLPTSPQASSTPNSTTFFKSIPNSTTFSKDDAVQLIQDWLDVKKKVFAAPFDRQTAARFNTGKRYQEIIGAIDWLQANKSYYRYPTAGKVEAAGKFSVSGNTATAIVQITESDEFYKDGSLTKTSESTTKTQTAQFQLENSTWKILSIN